MEKEIIKIPATISKIQTMSDKGLRVQVDSQELEPKDAGDVMSLKGKLGWFIFAEQINKEDIENLPQIELEDGEKQPSQRLRACLYVFWEQKKIQEPFDIFYRRQMDKYITSVKERLT